MKLFRTKVWSWLDIGLLKGACLLLGMIAGAYLAAWIRGHLWYVAGAALLLGIRPALAYFNDGWE